METKHAGCKQCKDKSQEILTSVVLKGEMMGFALCDKCLAEQRANKNTIEQRW
jgi:hypothetical protein